MNNKGCETYRDLNENTAKRYPLNISEKQVSKPREHTGGKIDIKNRKTNDDEKNLYSISRI